LPQSVTDTREINEALKWLNQYWNKPVEPIYYSPQTLEEAISILESYGKDAKIIAGGIDLLGLMKVKVLSPGVLVNIKSIPGLDTIRENGERLEIGALAAIDEIASSLLIRENYPLLFDITRSIASPQIRNMGTIGGNLCQEVRCWYYRRSPETGVSYQCRRKEGGRICYAVNGENENHAIFGESECVAVASSDMASGLYALDAEIRTASGRGQGVIPIHSFYTSLGNTLREDEIITGISIPKTKSKTRQRFLKFRPREAIDFSTVSVSSVVALEGDTIRDVKIVLGGVSPVPYEALKAEEMLRGKPLTENLAEKAAAAAVADAMPLRKNGYKVPIVKTLVKRSLLE
jgi:xanthine dehydrogenase YagS FAD-binding subunit